MNKCITTLALIFLVSGFSYSMEQFTQDQFILGKNRLPLELRNFINDFASWPKEDREKIEFVSLNSMVIEETELGDKQVPYGGSIANWIAWHTTNTQGQRATFIGCLKYLQQ